MAVKQDHPAIICSSGGQKWLSPAGEPLYLASQPHQPVPHTSSLPISTGQTFPGVSQDRLEVGRTWGGGGVLMTSPVRAGCPRGKAGDTRQSRVCVSGSLLLFHPRSRDAPEAG